MIDRNGKERIRSSCLPVAESVAYKGDDRICSAWRLCKISEEHETIATFIMFDLQLLCRARGVDFTRRVGRSPCQA